jgi:hypothetical protein
MHDFLGEIYDPLALFNFGFDNRLVIEVLDVCLEIGCQDVDHGMVIFVPSRNYWRVACAQDGSPAAILSRDLARNGALPTERRGFISFNWAQVIGGCTSTDFNLFVVYHLKAHQCFLSVF